MAGVREISTSDIPPCVALWNACCGGPRALLYAQLSPQTFQTLFCDPADGVRKINLVAELKGEVVGFTNGAVRDGASRAYITIVLVRDDARRRGIGKELLARLELALERAAENVTIELELMFFNPVALTWLIPGAGSHDHPNAPGVDVACDGYVFLKNCGYRDIAYQNSYYLPLSEYEFPKDIRTKIGELSDDGIRIVRFDPKRHDSFDELFSDLGNDEWREIVTANCAPGGAGDRVLIVEHGSRVCGFAGPLRVQESGRGYFAGIGVHSDYRGRGAGKVLFASLCMGLKQIGAEFMSLFTGEANPARNIYEAAGFKIVRTWADMRKFRS